MRSWVQLWCRESLEHDHPPFYQPILAVTQFALAEACSVEYLLGKLRFVLAIAKTEKAVGKTPSPYPVRTVRRQFTFQKLWRRDGPAIL